MVSCCTFQNISRLFSKLALGDDKVIPVDVRVIASTNKKLIQSVKENKFRDDLYYRINVLNLEIPS